MIAVAGLLATAALFTTSAPAGEAVRIVFHRDTTGAVYRVDGRMEVEQQTLYTGAGLPPRSATADAFSVTYSMDVLDLRDGDAGRRQRFTVRSLLRGEAGRPDRTLLPPGAVVEALKRNGVELHLVNGEEPREGELTYILGLVMEHDDGNDRLIDEVYGGDTPRRVGETWELDRGAFQARMAAHGVSNSPDRLSGRATIEARVLTNGVDCVRIKMESLNRDYTYTRAERWDSAGGTYNFKERVLLPVATNLPPQEFAQGSVAVESWVSEGAWQGLDYRVTRTLRRSASAVLLPPAPAP